jgi:RND family efflux transporter MFP subunit
MSKKKWALIPLLTLFILAALFLPFYFLHRARVAHRIAFLREEESPPLMRTLIVHPDNQEIELILPSFLDAINITPILARTNGYLVNWFVDIGDRVKRGDLLASIDTPDIDQELIQAEGDLKAALYKENITRITAERGLRLYECNPEAISKEELDLMIAAHNEALADIEAAQGRVGQYKFLQGFKNIYAPFDGTIIERGIDIGSLITAGSNTYAQRMFQIAKTDLLRAFVNVPQNYFHLIEDGLEAEVRIPQFPQKVFVGKIDRNAGALDQVARTLLTQVNIENQTGELLPGLYAEVTFKFPPAKNTFLIPIEALLIRSGPPYVAKVDSHNKICFQEVKIGRDHGASVQIIDGLSDGDEILANVTDRIKEGMEIKPAPTESCLRAWVDQGENRPLASATYERSALFSLKVPRESLALQFFPDQRPISDPFWRE